MAKVLRNGEWITINLPSDRIRMNNKIHTARTTGQFGSLTDENGKPAAAWCGQKSSQKKATYADPTLPVTCQKCLTD